MNIAILQNVIWISTTIAACSSIGYFFRWLNSDENESLHPMSLGLVWFSMSIILLGLTYPPQH